MHKDCIILAYQLAFGDIEILKKILLFLQTEHFCKIIYAISTEQTALETWILANYATYGMAVDITKHTDEIKSGEAIWKSLPYCDTEDILIINPMHFENFDILKLLSSQILNQADATIHLPANHQILLSTNKEIENGNCLPNNFNWGAMVIYKMSFISLSYPANFDIINDYCRNNINNKHHLFGFVNP